MSILRVSCDFCGKEGTPDDIEERHGHDWICRECAQEGHNRVDKTMREKVSMTKRDTLPESEVPKFILDACCGGRMFWFDKHHPNTVYVDNRYAPKGHEPHCPNHSVEPDEIMDFRDLKFPDKSFKLVVFDPPHMVTLQETSLLAKKYGCLNAQTWQSDLRMGFRECWRVLEDYGVLIFKWCDIEIPLKKVLALFDQVPLFGHTTGSKERTKWMVFMKIPGGNP